MTQNYEKIKEANKKRRRELKKNKVVRINYRFFRGAGADLE